MNIFNRPFIEKMEKLQKFLKDNNLVVTFDKGDCGIYICSKDDEMKMRLPDEFDGNQQ